MQVFQRIAKPFRVALRKESVDRNKQHQAAHRRPNVSLSARRAWIEIVDEVLTNEEQTVALRKESVDRNTASARPSPAANCRSPQGERG